MRHERFDHAGAFLNAVGPFLAEHEAENTVLAGAALRRLGGPCGDVAMLAVRDLDGQVRLAAIMTPPHNLVLSVGDPAAASCLTVALLKAGIRPPGIGGPGEELVRAFTAVWTIRQRVAAEPGLDAVLYRATEVAPPQGVPGELRTATAVDVAWLADWHARFAAETGQSAAEAAAARAQAAPRVGRGELVYWAVDGRPVATAGFIPTTPAGDAGRVNALFTPEAERGRGYAAACVAALSRRLLEARGWRYVLIYADRRNPTTNRMFPRLGYERIGLFCNVLFSYAA